MTRNITFERAGFWLGCAVTVWVLIAFIIMPLFGSLYAAFFRGGEFAIGQIASDLAGSNRVRTAMWNTVWMTAITAVTVTIVGVFQVAVLEYFHVRGRSILKIGFAVPLVFGGVIAASGYNFTYGPGGALTAFTLRLIPGMDPKWFHGWFGVLYAHTFLMTSFYFLFLRAAMRRVDYSIIEAARSMGASETTILRRVVLPVLMPTLLAVILLTVYTAIGSFAAPQILGGRDFYMISQVILTLNSLRRQDMAAALALLLGVVVMVLILAAQYYESRGARAGGAKTPVPIRLRRVQNPVANIALHGVAWVMWLIYVVPVALVVLFSFGPAADIGIHPLPTRLTLENYIRVFSEGSAFAPFFNSMRMGLIAVAAGLALTLFAVPVMLRHRNWFTRGLDIAFFLPWVVPSILLAVGLIAVFDRPNLLVFNQVLLGGFWILPIGYMVVILPLMVRFLRASFAGIDPAYDEAARSMGASALYRFRRITFPLVAPTAVLVAGMTFNDLMTEYPLSAFLYNVNNRPLPIAIVDNSVVPDPQQKALNLVYVTLIMGFSLAVIMLAERLGMGKGPETNAM
ncbi:iron ABC transporter permease [Paracoccus sp. (in: a-proteobacteria)]|uniref:ABC transporter permease n=1 Tax=Paracoccus sp. TaxID=267 RepID=UPI0026E0222F|nr:iron ABC transporter permease [Paracoccus sp. (in: a-proteobacteria)]MDO5648799.1 iron ABC transporter permease [Paracoccus sp. (in: a-proteobacteria)]